jgi:type I restriction enzyme M protein
VPFSNTTDWTLRKVYEEDHALLEENFRAYINGFSKNVATSSSTSTTAPRLA